MVALGSSGDNMQGGDRDASYEPFRLSLEALGLPKSVCEAHVNKLIEAGLLSDKDSGPENLILLAQDFVERPEVFSSLLVSDFNLPPLVAHQTRAAVMKHLKCVQENQHGLPMEESLEEQSVADVSNTIPLNVISTIDSIPKDTQSITNDNGHQADFSSKTSEPVPRSSYKSVVVNKHAKLRRSKKDSSNDLNYDYGLPPDYKTRFPTISLELDSFYTFMTRAATSSQDGPIRPATANVYMRHAKQFFGWYVTTYNITGDDDDSEQDLSIYKVFPSKEKSSADAVLEFILWLRSFRKISVSYEANILRGLTKLLKFRFAKESQSDPSYGEKSFDDIPLIREIRKLHREANKRVRVAPKSSDESQKWLSWPEYLQVVQSVRKELLQLMADFDQKKGSSKETINQQPPFGAPERKIATVFQRYLILAIFSSVPDRQRTIRELELERSFIKDEASGCWCIKHAPDDYKTGKAYGERPLMHLAEELTPWIDDFLERWRCCLCPSSQNLFVQPRTGKSLTQDSVYQIVGRACYQYAGKKTNPHLLRDMLVTHVRESDASEKQLEALALYMGHSIQMQRSSYDRRTLTKKVAPAIELMQFVNKNGVNGQ